MNKWSSKESMRKPTAVMAAEENKRNTAKARIQNNVVPPIEPMSNQNTNTVIYFQCFRDY